MKASIKKNYLKSQGHYTMRREFLRKSAVLSTLTGITGLGILTGCKEKEEEVTPSEDLMREHGLLNRIMLIYDTCRAHLMNDEQFPFTAIDKAAKIIRNFIEDYHEQLEEKFLFPLFAKANKMEDLIQLLYIQHAAGRKITDRIIQIAEAKPLNENLSLELIKLLGDFNIMYRPHEAREDTVLFPAIKKIIPEREYLALGEDFERKEHELFGDEGFEKMVEKVAGIERQLGIYDLAKFTPVL